MRSGVDEVVSSGLSGRWRCGMEGHGELTASKRAEEDGDGVVDGRHRRVLFGWVRRVDYIKKSRIVN